MSKVDLSDASSEDDQADLGGQASFIKTYQTLNACVGAIRPQFATILSKYEADFLRAYTSYMDKVHRELSYLQERMQETMNREMNDDSIGSLSRQIDLFSGEAQRINDTLEGQKREHARLKAEKRRLKRERRRMKAEIVEEMRLNKRCQITCTRVEKKNETLREFLKVNQKTYISEVPRGNAKLPKEPVSQQVL